MRVGFVVSQFPLLSETFVISQMEGLLARGFEVGVICDTVMDTHPDRQREPLSSLIRNTRLWWSSARLQRAVDRLPYGLRYKVAALLDLRFGGKLNDYDVIIAHFGKNGARVARAKRMGRTRTPVVTIFHGYDVGVPFKDNKCREYADLFRNGDLHLTVNKVFRDMLIESGAEAKKVAVHRMGVDVTRIPYTPRTRTEGAVRFVSVCRLVEKKGIEFALRAFAHETLRGTDWRYDIIGGGPLTSELEALATKLGIRDRVTFAGSLPHDEVKRRLHDYHAFILPSITSRTGDMEGVPVALMEAMASGLPVISSYHSGIPELITDGETGFLAPERDHEALAARILQVIADPASCDRIVAAARAKIEADHDNAALDDRIAAILNDLARQRAGQ
ncbi:glycosyltransferase [Falsirhodobacter sp. 20TX0035]|uniref:glycosyltransferase n=1 Tax=Falsirhodobacter sp. 20TX0035 TaxID=3022019 RepID=UPI00232EFBB5|nr:glycosyltransferase [Falsirhodobacter sp. 20TX0035]MDB6454790.1 glycosyltransferase [Falsirhodobacter sp. 20TX0035]